MDQRRARYTVSALILIGFSLFNFFTYATTTTYQLTFAVQPNMAEDISTTRNSGDMVSGQFQETGGLRVSFYILNSAQFAAHQVGGTFNYLYSIVDVSSSSFSYNIPVQDTYYFFFDHGTGLSGTDETVYFQRSYVTHDIFRLELGVIFLVVAGVDFVFALRTKRAQPTALPFPSPTSLPTNPPTQVS